MAARTRPIIWELEEYAVERTIPWLALSVRMRHEKNVTKLVANKGFPTYLPVYHARHKWSDRVKDVALPLFPGYVFARVPVEHRLPVLLTPGVIRILGGPEGPTPVSDSEIAAVERIVASGYPYGPMQYLAEGALVEIVMGPLRGLHGILQKIKNSHRLVVSIGLLQRSVFTEVDVSWVRPERLPLREERRHASKRFYPSSLQPPNPRWLREGLARRVFGATGD